MGDFTARGKYLCALTECLVAHAVDGVVRLTRTELRALTGISERALGNQLATLAEHGVIEFMPGRGVTSAMSYRIVNADLVFTETSWTGPRVEMMEAEYPHRWNPALLNMLLALPGAALTVDMVKDFAGKRGLKKTPELLATRQAPNRTGARKVVAPKVKAARVFAEPAIPPDPHPLHVSGMRFASSVTSRLPRIDWAALPKLAPRDGCRWPLTCAEPATGAFCDAHRGMLR